MALFRRVFVFLLIVFIVSCGDDGSSHDKTDGTGEDPDVADTEDFDDSDDKGDVGNTGDTGDDSDISDTGNTGNTGDSSDDENSEDTGEPNVSYCAKECSVSEDCAEGVAIMDADNFSCEDNICVYNGCNNDKECEETFSSADYACNTEVEIPSCVQRCETPDDCFSSAAEVPAYDADNYSCVSGKCIYTGCNSDEECRKTYEATEIEYVCDEIEGAGVPHCVIFCEAVSQCTQHSSENGAYSEDNYLCEENRCVYKGCNSHKECVNTFEGDERYICVEIYQES
ncbi:MAG: hypothetical protein R6W70_01620 [bacterium]